MRIKFCGLLVAIAIAGAASVSLAQVAKDGEKLFNGKDTTGWKLVDPKMTDSWKAVTKAEMDPDDNKKLRIEGEGGTDDALLVRSDIKKGSDLYTEKEFGDCELHVEFLIPKGSNSGVYLMGRYEVQIYDTFGKPDDKLGPGDCGGVYHNAAPKTNAMKAPGEWQSFDIVFRAPRFDADGKKTENAKFVNVVFNGTVIHENAEAKGPTGGVIDETEKATGPIMLQGNHGVVAFRNLRIKPIEDK